LPKPGCSASTAPGADAPAAFGRLLDRGQLGDLLDVDDGAGLRHAGAHLHQQVGAAGQDAGRAGGGGEGADGLVQRSWRQVSDVCHAASHSPGHPIARGACFFVRVRRAHRTGEG
jgi:hypothetical protein